MTGLMFLLVACRATPPATDPTWESLLTWASDARQDWAVPGMAVALLRPGEPTLTQGLGVRRQGEDAPVTPDSVFRLGSLSKLMTGVLVLQETASGRLDPQAPVSAALPGLELAAPDSLDQVTLAQLLSHSGGLQSVGLPNTCGVGPDALAEELAARVPDWGLWVAPDTLFQYASPGFALAGLALEQAAGRDFAGLAAERLFLPAGLDSATYDPAVGMGGDWAEGHSVRPETGEVAVFRTFDGRACGASFPSGGLMASITDLARVGEVLLDGGAPWLDPGSFETLTTTGWTLSPSASYGWGLLPMAYRGHRVWLHTGSLKGYQSLLAVLPDEGAGVAVLVNSDHAVVTPPQPWSKPTQRVALRALDLLLGLEPLTLTSSARPVEEWGAYVGDYVSDFDFGTASVWLDGETLLLALDVDGETHALTPYGLDSFVYAYEGTDGLTWWDTVSFEAGEDGVMAWLQSASGVAARVNAD